MRILFLGDIVGKPGVTFVKRSLSVLVPQERIDMVIANAENATDGSGLSPKDYRRLRDAGVDLVTLGDHVYRKRDIIPTLQEDEHICRPANFPPGAPGRDFAVATARDGRLVAAFALLGRTYMRPADCPYRAADRVLQAIGDRTRCVVLDMHAEATADKYLMAHYLKGRISAVLGTHTHVPTADEQILDGTAYITDVGMTGPYASVLGRRVDRVLSTAVTYVPVAFDVATDDPRLGGVLVDIDASSGKASSIQRFILDEQGLAKIEQTAADPGDGAA
jgi:2',3'-cyclic-nucleotide 2'-phosphodiesterase